MYSRIITEEIIRLQAHGFTVKETQNYLQEHYSVKPSRNTISRHRCSPIGKEMLEELIRQQERSILKQDTESPQLAMRYRSDLIGKMMDKLLPTLANVETTHTERIEEIKVLWLKKDELTPTHKLRATPKPITISPE